MPNALESGAAKTAEEEAHRRRWAHLQEVGWKLTSQGLVLDMNDLRCRTTSRLLGPYSDEMSFETATRIRRCRR